MRRSYILITSWCLKVDTEFFSTACVAKIIIYLIIIFVFLFFFFMFHKPMEHFALCCRS